MLSSSEISMEKDVLTKQEDTGSKSKITKASSSSRQWAWLKDPRVVRVSRAFGGKDRHSKVCTIRGLRDRRVRLSVPTAIQLYDLQDRLGLSQPSKVVDWLLNAAKHEIDELPPLQMPAGTFGHFPQSIVANHEVHAQQSSFSSLVGRTISHEKHQGLQPSPSTKGSLNINDHISPENQGIGFKSTYWNLNAPSGSNYKEVARATIMDKTNWIKRNEPETRDDVEIHNAQVPSSQYLSKANNSSLPSLPDNVVPYNSHYPLDSASLSLSNFGSHGQSIQPEDPQSYNVLPVPSALSLPPTSQLLLCPPVAPVPPFFSPYLANHTESSMKQLNQIPMVSSSSHNAFINSLTPSFYSLSQPVRPFQLNINPKLPHSQSENSSP